MRRNKRIGRRQNRTAAHSVNSMPPYHIYRLYLPTKENAQEQAENMDAYLMLSFDTFKAKAAFCERFGYNAYDKFIKGEVFDGQVERIE